MPSKEGVRDEHNRLFIHRGTDIAVSAEVDPEGFEPSSEQFTSDR